MYHAGKPITLTTLVVSLIAAGALAACDRAASPQALDQQVDRPAAQAEAQGGVAREGAGSATSQAGPAQGGAADSAANKSQDEAITATVRAALSQDERLGVLRIDVDTVNGHVALRGNVPDANSRDRATLIAKAVPGVRSVDNLIEIA